MFNARSRERCRGVFTIRWVGYGAKFDLVESTASAHARACVRGEELEFGGDEELMRELESRGGMSDSQCFCS